MERKNSEILTSEQKVKNTEKAKERNDQLMTQKNKKLMTELNELRAAIKRFESEEKKNQLKQDSKYQNLYNSETKRRSELETVIEHMIDEKEGMMSTQKSIKENHEKKLQKLSEENKMLMRKERASAKKIKDLVRQYKTKEDSMKKSMQQVEKILKDKVFLPLERLIILVQKFEIRVKEVERRVGEFKELHKKYQKRCEEVKRLKIIDLSRGKIRVQESEISALVSKASDELLKLETSRREQDEILEEKNYELEQIEEEINERARPRLNDLKNKIRAGEEELGTVETKLSKIRVDYLDKKEEYMEKLKELELSREEKEEEIADLEKQVLDLQETLKKEKSCIVEAVRELDQSMSSNDRSGDLHFVGLSIISEAGTLEEADQSSESFSELLNNVKEKTRQKEEGYKSKIRELENKLNEKDEVKNYFDKYKKCKRLLKQKTQQLEEKNEEHKEAEKKIRDYKQKLRTKTADFDQANRKFEESKRGLEEKESRVIAAEKRIEKLESDDLEYREQINLLNDDLLAILEVLDTGGVNKGSSHALR